MKRKPGFLFVLTIVVGMGWMSGCNKQDAAMDARNVQPVMKTESVDDAGPEKQILSFISECERQRNKQGLLTQKMLPLPGTAWLLEATFNYVFGHPMDDARERSYDTVIVSLPFTGDSVSMTVATTCANKLLDSLSKFYAACSGSDKSILTITVEGASVMQDGLLDLTVVFEAGCKINHDDHISVFNFNDSNFWFWGYGQGQCGPYTGTSFGNDAATIMMAHQNFFKPVVILSPGMRIYYTDFINRKANPYDLPNPNNTVPSDNYFDYLLYLSNPVWPNHHDCLSPTEMNFYFHKLIPIIYQYLFPAGATQADYHFVSLNIDPTPVASPCPPGLLNANSHQLRVKYGKPHYAFGPDPASFPNYQWN